MNTAFVPVFVAVGGHSAVGVGEAFFGRSLYYVYRLTDLVRQKKPNAADRWTIIILWSRSKTHKTFAVNRGQTLLCPYVVRTICLLSEAMHN